MLVYRQEQFPDCEERHDLCSEYQELILSQQAVHHDITNAELDTEDHSTIATGKDIDCPVQDDNDILNEG